MSDRLLSTPFIGQSTAASRAPDAPTPHPAAPPTHGDVSPPLAFSPEAAAPRIHVYPLRFTGSGAEYFRIWIVNLLLTLVTLGLYYPWSKVRRLRYFLGHTEIDGRPLDFHADPRRMLRGFLLVSLMMVLYGAAGRVSPTAGAIAGVIVALIWPALMRASLQFRLSQTSWSGLRLAFHGSLWGAYLVFLVPLAIGVMVMCLGMLVFALLPGPWRGMAAPALGIAAVLIWALLAPYVWWRLKRFQHGHYALGTLQTGFRARYGQALRLFAKTAGMSLAILLVGAVLVGVFGALVGGFDTPPAALAETDRAKASAARVAAVMTWLMPALVGVFLLNQMVVGPFFTASAQNLIWTETGNRRIRFKSHLARWRYIGLAAGSWVLTVLTLGLYWPFAAVALTRAKVEALELHARMPLDSLVGQARGTQSDATGDLAADLIGIDFGL